MNLVDEHDCKTYELNVIFFTLKKKTFQWNLKTHLMTTYPNKPNYFLMWIC